MQPQGAEEKLLAVTVSLMKVILTCLCEGEVGTLVVLTTTSTVASTTKMVKLSREVDADFA